MLSSCCDLATIENTCFSSSDCDEELCDTESYRLMWRKGDTLLRTAHWRLRKFTSVKTRAWLKRSKTQTHANQTQNFRTKWPRFKGVGNWRSWGVVGTEWQGKAEAELAGPLPKALRNCLADIPLTVLTQLHFHSNRSILGPAASVWTTQRLPTL